MLRRKVDDREAKNYELFKLANEILTRYEKFGLGEALTAREPFTGLTRVKRENLCRTTRIRSLNNDRNTKLLAW